MERNLEAGKSFYPTGDDEGGAGDSRILNNDFVIEKSSSNFWKYLTSFIVGGALMFGVSKCDKPNLSNFADKSVLDSLSSQVYNLTNEQADLSGRVKDFTEGKGEIIKMNYASKDLVDSVNAKVNQNKRNLLSLFSEVENVDSVLSDFRSEYNETMSKVKKDINENSMQISEAKANFSSQLDSLKKYINEVTGKVDSTLNEVYNSMALRLDEVRKDHEHYVAFTNHWGKPVSVESSSKWIKKYVNSNEGLKKEIMDFASQLTSTGESVSNYNKEIEGFIKPVWNYMLDNSWYSELRIKQKNVASSAQLNSLGK